MENKLQEIILTEYETMRSEIRLYINKLYLGLSIITGVIFYGVFRESPDKNGFIYIWIPYIISATIGFMTMVSFFINKTAGYVRVLEHRLARKYDSVIPNKANLDDGARFHLAPIFWESFYADYNMKRDKGKTFRSLFFGAIIMMIFPGVAMLSIVLYLGYQEAIKWQILFAPYINVGVVYIISSLVSIASASYLYWYVVKENRDTIIALNKLLMAKMESDDIHI